MTGWTPSHCHPFWGREPYAETVTIPAPRADLTMPAGFARKLNTARRGYDRDEVRSARPGGRRARAPARSEPAPQRGAGRRERARRRARRELVASLLGEETVRAGYRRGGAPDPRPADEGVEELWRDAQTAWPACARKRRSTPPASAVTLWAEADAEVDAARPEGSDGGRGVGRAGADAQRPARRRDAARGCAAAGRCDVWWRRSRMPVGLSMTCWSSCVASPPSEPLDVETVEEAAAVAALAEPSTSRSPDAELVAEVLREGEDSRRPSAQRAPCCRSACASPGSGCAAR